MSIPSFDAIMLPLLQLLADGKEWKVRDAVEELANRFGLSPEERSETLSRGQPKFAHRVGWARTYLKMAGLIASPPGQRGVMVITQRGQEVLATRPPAISVKYLLQFPEFTEWYSPGKLTKEPSSPETPETPLERLELAYEELRSALASELQERVQSMSAPSFERLVVELLLRMGYGGPHGASGLVTGGSGDGGVDGLISEDKLGLDVIYIQAKRWQGQVGAQEVRSFVGALATRGAQKGVFITTSGFTKEARQVVEQLRERKVVLIDGKTLVQLMIDHNVGVYPVQSYEVKHIDSDYFSEG